MAFGSSDGALRVAVHAWTDGLAVEREAHAKLSSLARMSNIIRHPIAVMPDVHYGKGATVGTVIPTNRALIPACVGVDIGCGMVAVRTSLLRSHLPANLAALRLSIEVSVPHGRSHAGQAENDAGGWRGSVPLAVSEVWKEHLASRFRVLCSKHPQLEKTNNINHLGTLGTGNHFIEVCEDESGRVWVMLHSGSRGVGNRIGSLFIEMAKQDMGALVSHLPDQDYAYLEEGTQHFKEYVEAVAWSQDYAMWNRELMLKSVLKAMRATDGVPPFHVDGRAINCHHNYIERFSIGTEDVWLTRKGATCAAKGVWAIVPGSMGAPSFIVEGLGNAASYCSCSHGAGRQFSRSESTRRFTVEEHEVATAGIECRKDKDVLDETPMAYKDIYRVMAAQSDLVTIKHTLRQVVCVKG